MAAKKTKKLNSTVLKFFGLSILAGTALSLPFWHYQMGWLVLVACLPFFYLLLQLSNQKDNSKAKIGYIWLSGFTFLLLVTFWLLQTQPERWAGLTNWWATGMLVIVYLLFAGILSLGFLLFGIGWVYLRLALNQKRIFLLLPALWVTCEWARSWMFSIISIGPNTALGAHWNFGTLGFATSVTPIVFLGRLVGLFGLSFAIVAISICIFWLLQKRWKLPLLILVSIGLFTILGWALYRIPSGKAVDVAALQLGTNQDLQIGSIGYHAKLNQLVKPGGADVLIMPEYSEIFNEQSLDNDKTFATQMMSNLQAPIITSVQRSNNDKNYNTLTVYKPNGTITYQNDKQFLIPIGEAMPYAISLPLKALGQGSSIKIREVSRGLNSANAYIVDGLTIGSQACSGAISPELYRELVNGGAQILTNSASLSIFADAKSYHQQAQQMARFMAVANARPFVQATDGSYSFIIDNNGNWLAKSGQKDIELLQQKVYLNSHRTLYSIIGEWAVIASMVILAGQMIHIVHNKNLTKKPQPL